MTITLNGLSHPVAPETTVAGLLKSLGLNDKPVVVELDGHVVFPRELSEKRLVDGARIEIVMLAAGG